MTKVDYSALEKEYVEGRTPISIRKLAERHGMSFSTVADYARRHDWAAKRQLRTARLAERSIERYVDNHLEEAAQARREMILTARAAIARYAQQLSDNDNPERVSARDAAAMMDKLLLLMGDPTERREEKHLGISITATGGLDEPALRRLLELSRKHVTPELEGDPALRLEGAGEA
jgi:hypothetical protein